MGFYYQKFFFYLLPNLYISSDKLSRSEISIRPSWLDCHNAGRRAALGLDHEGRPRPDPTMNLIDWTHLHGYALQGASFVLAVLLLVVFALLLAIDTRLKRQAQQARAQAERLQHQQAELQRQLSDLSALAEAPPPFAPPEVMVNPHGWKCLNLERFKERHAQTLERMVAEPDTWEPGFVRTGALAWFDLKRIEHHFDPARRLDRALSEGFAPLPDVRREMTAASAYWRTYIPQDQYRFDEVTELLLLGMIAYRWPVSPQQALNASWSSPEAPGGDKTHEGYADEWDLFLLSLTADFLKYTLHCIHNNVMLPSVSAMQPVAEYLLRHRGLKFGKYFGEQDLRKILSATLILCGADIPRDLLLLSPTLVGQLTHKPLPRLPSDGQALEKNKTTS